MERITRSIKSLQQPKRAPQLRLIPIKNPLLLTIYHDTCHEKLPPSRIIITHPIHHRIRIPLRIHILTHTLIHRQRTHSRRRRNTRTRKKQQPKQRKNKKRIKFHNRTHTDIQNPTPISQPSNTIPPPSLTVIQLRTITSTS